MPEEVAETADLLSAWAVSRGYWTAAEENEVRERAARAGMTDLLLPMVEKQELDVPSLLLPGTRVAFTGRNDLLGGPADDERLKEICESCNLEYKKNMSKSKCDVLVAHDPGSQSRKAQAAREHGKPIISQEDFEHWYYHGPFLLEANDAKQPIMEPSPIATPETSAIQESFADENEAELTWVRPEEFLEEGTRVAFRGSTYVQGVLLPQGEPLQGLCSILGLEYKQAVTKTRCDVLVTDAPEAFDGKMKLAKIYDKPLILQSDFDTWASNRLSELDSEEVQEVNFDEVDEFEDSLEDEWSETFSEGTDAEEWDPGATPHTDDQAQGYATYLAKSAETEQEWKTPILQGSGPIVPKLPPQYGTYAPIQSTPSASTPDRPKTKRAAISAGLSAAAAVVLFITAVTLIITETAEALQVVTFMTSIVAGIATIIFGIIAVINRILNK